MKTIKYLTLTGFFIIILVLGWWFAGHDKNLIWQETIYTENFGNISVAYPLFGGG